jgi:hypothetical protein
LLGAHVLHLGYLVVVGEDHGTPLAGERAHFSLERADLLGGELGR